MMKQRTSENKLSHARRWQSLVMQHSCTRCQAQAPVLGMQVMQAYYDASVPQPGQDFEFIADSSLQPVHYYRPPLHQEQVGPEHVHRLQVANAEAEAAAGLRNWTLAVLCRCLSLDNVLSMLTGKC